MRKGLKKAYEITDAKISFVSLVDKAANKRQFLLKKADDGKASFTSYGRTMLPALCTNLWRRTATATT